MEKFNKIPQQIIDDLRYEIARNGLDCADNFRAYRVKDAYLMQEFMKAYHSGCCGVFEGSTFYNGDKWIIGCNHGH